MIKKQTDRMGENEVSIRGRILREIIAHFHSDQMTEQDIMGGGIRKRLEEAPWKSPEGYEVLPVSMENFEMELLQSEEDKGELVVLQLHGGGYVGKLRNSHRATAVLYSRAGKGCNVLTIDYRVAPEHPYPAALEDGLAAYYWLLEQGYTGDKILLGGDSAGGGLAMAMTMYLRDHGQELPKGIVAMSPWTDLTASGTSYDDNFEIDPLFGKTRESLIYNNAYPGEEDPENPYISPMFGSFEDFPPMLVQVGTLEMLLSDSITVVKKARQAGVKVRFGRYEGMFHVFQRAMLLLPESRKAWIEVERFIEKINEPVTDQNTKRALPAKDGAIASPRPE